MVNGNRWGIAAIVAALALGTPALASSTAGTQGSSGSSDTGKGSTSSGTASSGSTSAGKPDKKLTEAVQRLHADNQAEIHMGQMAQQMGTSQEVKDFGKKLASDHQKNDEKLTTLAQSKGIDLNGEAFQDEQKHAQKNMEKLHGKSGADFDKAFMSMMVKDHEKDVKAVEKATKEAQKKNQTELATYLAATHTGLQGHLQTAQRIEKDLKSGKSDAASSGTGSGAISPGGGTGGSTTGSSGSSGSSTSGTHGSETGGGGGH
jgi:putative membrane protein